MNQGRERERERERGREGERERGREGEGLQTLLYKLRSKLAFTTITYIIIVYINTIKNTNTIKIHGHQ